LNAEEAEKRAKEHLAAKIPSAKSVSITQVGPELRPEMGTGGHAVWIVKGKFEDEERKKSFEVIFSPNGAEVLGWKIGPFT
jgi:hypothetical protein